MSYYSFYRLCLFALVLGAVSCEKTVLGTKEANTPEHNFDILWEDFDAHYALFNVKSIHWDSLYQVYRPQISSTTTQAELWELTTQLLAHLDDGHVKVVNTQGDIYESGQGPIKDAETAFDFNLITTTYLEDVYTSSEKGITYGKIKDKPIGYIHMFDVEGDNPDKIHDILATLDPLDGLILDLRNNSGGTDDYAHRIAGAFADGKHEIYSVQTRNGINHSDFDEKTIWYTQPIHKTSYLKPVVLLTSRYTVSAAEILTLALKSFPHVVHMGDTTKGDFSDQCPLRFLPNGWTYAYSNQLYTLPNGTCLEGIGIAPDVLVKNTPQDVVVDGVDRVLEKGILSLE